MSDNFQVYNPGLDEDHAQLLGITNSVRRVVEDLNNVLAHLPNATQNSGVAPWSGLQNEWNTAYWDMNAQLASIHSGSVGAHEAYKAGDCQAYRAML